MKSVIIFVIAFVLLIPTSAFAEDITIIEVESNPAGYDEGNEWVRLFNPFSNFVDLSGWKISSTHGVTNTYTLSENINSCDELKIVFSTQFLDNVGESLILYDKSGNVVDSTPVIDDGDNDGTTWKGQTPSCVSHQQEEPVIEEPVIEEPVIEEPVQEQEYLENGCPVDYPYLWRDGMCYTTIERVYKESKMGFYENERYDFSFEAPMNWSYQEGVSYDDGITTFEVIQFPTEFSLKNAGDDANMLDLGMAMSGITFQFESPLIYVDFENIPSSKVSKLSEESIYDYLFDKIVTTYPSAKMIDSWTISHDWGWEVYAMYNHDLNIGYGSGIPYVSEEFLYVFDDRESYTVGYGAPDVYFDEYRPVFDHVLETLIIKSVAIPEFGSIAMLILVTSIIAVIISARKFQVIK